MKNIYEIAKKAHIKEEYVVPYGLDKCKVDLSIFSDLKEKKDGKLVLVTAITPTKAGEGKTTTSIALLDGFYAIGQEALLCLREPSLGPVFGLKGGATGGGKASVIPSEDINLHFTGDMHALTSSINLISAIIDNHIYQGNELHIDPNHIVWTRAMDMNDRALRNITVSEQDKKMAPHSDEFVITVASELMAIFCLSVSKEDFHKRINEMIVAYTFDNAPVRLKDLQISNAVMKLMDKAFMPNLVQTLEENPVLIHGGPFANIAHGCNSLFATKLALKLSPIVITEAGFGADLGAEKFMDIAARAGSLHPDAVVMVATLRALKMHGGASENELEIENIPALEKGVTNLKAHMDNMAKFHVPCVIAINHFANDPASETEWLIHWCRENHYEIAFSDAYDKGGEGSKDLASLVLNTLKTKPSAYEPLYHLDDSLWHKVEFICKNIYHAKEVVYSDKAKAQMEEYIKMGYGDSYICMAKTPQSFTDNPKILGAPTDFTITVREVRLSAGARFVIPLTGNVMTMPGLPKVPAAVKMEKE